MEIKKCLNSEVPTPSNGTGYFYLDQETNKLKLKKSSETISWDLISDEYNNLPAEETRLLKILENDKTPGYSGKILIQFISNNDVKVPINAGYYPEDPENMSSSADAYRTSDGNFYVDDELSEANYHIFNGSVTDKYVIAYYKENSKIYDRQYPWPYNGVLDGGGINGNLNYIKRIVCYNMDFTKICSPYINLMEEPISLTLMKCKTYDANSPTKFTGAYENYIDNLYVADEYNTLKLGNLYSHSNFWFTNIHCKLDISNCDNFSFGWWNSYTETLNTIIFSNNVKYLGSLISECENLRSLAELDLSNYSGSDIDLSGCSLLKYLGGFKGLKVSLSLANSRSLIKASLLNVLNNLADVTELGTEPTLTLAADSYVKLTADEIAIGTNKGWIIATA